MIYNIILGISTTILIFLLFSVKEILTPFILAIASAYALNPIVGKISTLTRMRNRTFSSVITMFLFLILITAILTIAVPVLFSQISVLIKEIPTLTKTIHGILLDLATTFLSNFDENIVKNVKEILRESLIIDNSTDEIYNFLRESAPQFTKSIFTSGLDIIHTIFSTAIYVIILYYTLNDFPKINESISQVLYTGKYKNLISEKMTQVNNIISIYLQGQVYICLSLAVIYSFLLHIIGLKSGFSIGLITGILSFVPYVGTMFGVSTSIISTLLYHANDNYMLMSVIIIFALVNFTESYYIIPNTVGKKMGLHPSWTIISIIIGANLMGFIGIIISIPVAAIASVFVKEIANYHIRKNKT